LKLKNPPPRRAFLIAYTALLGALSIVLGWLVKVPFPLGNPNLGSTPVSIAAVTATAPVAFAVAIIKGLGVSLSTGQALLELPAGVGDGFMALFTYWLSKRINPAAAVLMGQLSRYIFTSGMIALVLGSVAAVNPSYLGAFTTFSKLTSAQPSTLHTGLSSLATYVGMVWVAMIPAITASIVANAVLSVAVAVAMQRFYPSLLRTGRLPKEQSTGTPSRIQRLQGYGLWPLGAHARPDPGRMPKGDAQDEPSSHTS
jgi:uncharacterized membrane protein